MNQLLRFALLYVFGSFLLIGCYEEGFAPAYEDVAYEDENYVDHGENPFIVVEEEPISTFSIDADGGSYANIRRFINDNSLPPVGAVRIEEMINYFQYDYPEPEGAMPFSVEGEVSKCPWTPDHKLIRIGMKGKDIPFAELPPSNFVFLIDVSGSMDSEDKLPLLKEGFKMLTNILKPTDRIAIVTYAGSAGVVLPSTSGDQKETIKDAIDALGAGGSTAGAEGIITAYEIAEANFVPGGNNRIIVGTDGDFNVGPSSTEDLISLIEEKRETGIFVSVLGVGTGNYNDNGLEQLADNGNGTYEYIDNYQQALKVFVYEYSKFFNVAKDVKVQVVFNPDVVQAYRLIGYENRVLATEDFEDDEEDAGDLGADQNVTALYEIIPAESGVEDVPTFTIDLRYKNPDEDVSQLVEFDIMDANTSFDSASESMRFAASVAGFGMLLRDSEYKGSLNYSDLIPMIENSNNNDTYGFKAELIELVQKAKDL